MAYLTRDGNFMNSMLVAQWDDSFIDSVVETMSNMYFRGKDGWKQIFSGETSQNQAWEVLIALLDSYSELCWISHRQKQQRNLLKYIWILSNRGLGLCSCVWIK